MSVDYRLKARASTRCLAEALEAAESGGDPSYLRRMERNPIDEASDPRLPFFSLSLSSGRSRRGGLPSEEEKRNDDSERRFGKTTRIGDSGKVNGSPNPGDRLSITPQRGSVVLRSEHPFLDLRRRCSSLGGYGDVDVDAVEERRASARESGSKKRRKGIESVEPRSIVRFVHLNTDEPFDKRELPLFRRVTHSHTALSCFQPPESYRYPCLSAPTPTPCLLLRLFSASSTTCLCPRSCRSYRSYLPVSHSEPSCSVPCSRAPRRTDPCLTPSPSLPPRLLPFIPYRSCRDYLCLSPSLTLIPLHPSQFWPTNLP